MNSLRRLLSITLLLLVDHAAHAEPRRLVVTAPEYPEGEMHDKEKVMATLASYLLWPAQNRPAPPSQLYAEYAKYCNARWALTSWNLRDSEYLKLIGDIRKELHAWSNRLAPVANSRNGCVTGIFYREYWANEMKLEDALAATADSLPKAGDGRWKVEQRTLDRLEWMVWSITPFERQPGATAEDDPVNVKDFAKDKYELVKATQRLSTLLKELPVSASFPLLDEIRRTLGTLHD
jgi:hypothetical protein